MNKKGFAISVILYVIVFLIIAILYILLGIVKARYSTNSGLKNNVVNTLNGIEYIYSKLDNDGAINTLIINPNGGSILWNEEEVTDTIDIVEYFNNTVVIPDPTKENYIFVTWDDTDDCGDFTDGVYTFPTSYGTTCTLTARWDMDTE